MRRHHDPHHGEPPSTTAPPGVYDWGTEELPVVPARRRSRRLPAGSTRRTEPSSIWSEPRSVDDLPEIEVDRADLGRLASGAAPAPLDDDDAALTQEFWGTTTWRTRAPVTDPDADPVWDERSGRFRAVTGRRTHTGPVRTLGETWSRLTGQLPIIGRGEPGEHLDQAAVHGEGAGAVTEAIGRVDAERSVTAPPVAPSPQAADGPVSPRLVPARHVDRAPTRSPGSASPSAPQPSPWDDWDEVDAWLFEGADVPTDAISVVGTAAGRDRRSGLGTTTTTTTRRGSTSHGSVRPVEDEWLESAQPARSRTDRRGSLEALARRLGLLVVVTVLAGVLVAVARPSAGFESLATDPAVMAPIGLDALADPATTAADTGDGSASSSPAADEDGTDGIGAEQAQLASAAAPIVERELDVGSSPDGGAISEAEPAGSEGAGTASPADGATATDADAPVDEEPSVDADDAPTAAAAATSEPLPRRVPACAQEYTAQRGDYWLRLAGASGVPLDDLLAANGATTSTPLYPGSEICLPPGARTPAPPSTAAPTTAAPTPGATSPAPVATAPPTTAAPTTTTQPPTTTAAPPSRSAAEQIIRDVWPDDLEDRAIEVAIRESNLQANVRNFCCFGLFQIYWNVHRGWLAGYGVTSSAELYDARTNTEMAYVLYQRSGGWGPWGG